MQLSIFEIVFNMITLINVEIWILLAIASFSTAKFSAKKLRVKTRKRNLGPEWRPINSFQTYFCGEKLPIDAEMDGATFTTSQWVKVES